MEGNEAYLRIKLKNANLDLQRTEKRLAELRIELGHWVDLYAIQSNTVAHIESVLKEMYNE